MHGFLSFICLITFLILSLVDTRVTAQEVSLTEPVEGWGRLVRTANVETKYEVKKGDNLYDISDVLFGDAHYWPKVWSLNAGLTNPHIVEIGQIIYFDSGNVVRPPSFSLASRSEGTYLVSESLVAPIIPKQAPKVHLKEIPSTLPQLFGNQKTLDIEESLLAQLEIGKRFVLDQQESIFLYTEIVTKKPESIGRVSVTEDDSNFAKVGEHVVLSLDSSVSIGELLSVYEISQEEDTFSIISWMGEAKVVKPMGYDGLKYKAVITRANQEITKGSKVSLRPLKNFIYKDESEVPSVSVKDFKVIGGENSLDRVLFSEGDIVYLSQGEGQGVTVGDVFLIERSLKHYYSFSKANDIPGSSSYVKIISSDPRYSTGVLYNMTNIISTGLNIRTENY